MCIRDRSDSAGIRTGAFGASLYAMRTPIRLGVAALVVLLYVMAAHPTGAFTLTLLLVAALVLLLVELLARPPVDPVPSPAPAHSNSDPAAR